MPSRITKWLKFQHEEGAIFPPDLAREYLGISRQALDSAAKRKKLRYVTLRNVRYYGMNSLNEYKWLRAARRSIEKRNDEENLDI